LVPEPFIRKANAVLPSSTNVRLGEFAKNTPPVVNPTKKRRPSPITIALLEDDLDSGDDYCYPLEEQRLRAFRSVVSSV
jgi:hypothetical protein